MIYSGCNQERGNEMAKNCENCGGIAEVYAMGPRSGDWAGYYCEAHIPTGFNVTDRFKREEK